MEKIVKTFNTFKVNESRTNEISQKAKDFLYDNNIIISNNGKLSKERNLVILDKNEDYFIINTNLRGLYYEGLNLEDAKYIYMTRQDSIFVFEYDEERLKIMGILEYEDEDE